MHRDYTIKLLYSVFKAFLEGKNSSRSKPFKRIVSALAVDYNGAYDGLHLLVHENRKAKLFLMGSRDQRYELQGICEFND